MLTGSMTSFQKKPCAWMRTNRFDDNMCAQFYYMIFYNIIYHNNMWRTNERRVTRGTIRRLAHQPSIFYIIIAARGCTAVSSCAYLKYNYVKLLSSVGMRVSPRRNGKNTSTRSARRIAAAQITPRTTVPDRRWQWNDGRRVFGRVLPVHRVRV